MIAPAITAGEFVGELVEAGGRSGGTLPLLGGGEDMVRSERVWL